MPTQAEYRAREEARMAGYDPDQLVIEIDQERDFDYLSIGLAPVDIKKLKPMYKRFQRESREIIARELCDG